VVTGDCLFEAFDPVIDIGPTCARLTAHPRLFAVLADLYGEEPCLFKDKLIFKPPSAQGYDLHQDYIGWRNFPRSFLTALVAIDGADQANGCTEVFPGHHLRGYLSPEDGNYHPLPVDAVADTHAVGLDLRPGDVAFFGCFLPHRSGPNQSTRWRRQLYLSYNACSDGGLQRAHHYLEFHHWLRQRYAEHGKHAVYFR
jgi:ectoine hydroxylase-related dioxygenase (phytanoyl-CoA dioxygenase family)